MIHRLFRLRSLIVWWLYIKHIKYSSLEPPYNFLSCLMRFRYFKRYHFKAPETVFNRQLISSYQSFQWRAGLHRCEAIAAITLIPRQLQFISNLRRITFHSGNINGRFSSWPLFIRQNSSRDCGWVNNCSGRIYEPLSNALLMQSRETLTRFCGSFCFEGDNFGDRPRLLTYSTDAMYFWSCHFISSLKLDSQMTH